jgi:transcriptional regulator with XRE-family HTH domain
MAKRLQPGLVGRNIVRIRERLGLRQAELAERAGLRKSTLSNLERGQNQQPTAATLAKIAAALDVPVDALTSTEVGQLDVREVLAEFEVSPFAAQLVPPLQDAERAFLAEWGPRLWAGVRPPPQAIFLLVTFRRSLPVR